jgi:hypothetical protein
VSFSNLAVPVKAINGYLWDTMKRIDTGLAAQYDGLVPFFPMSDSSSGASMWEDKPYIIYDRILKLSPSPFYPTRTEHIIYSLKANEEETYEWGTAIQYILDRQDDAAKDINSWNGARANPEAVYFHHLSAYQSGGASSTRGGAKVRDFSNRPYYITQFIIDAEYHYTNSIESFLA